MRKKAATAKAAKGTKATTSYTQELERKATATASYAQELERVNRERFHEIEKLQEENRELLFQLKMMRDARDFYRSPRDDYKALLEQERLHLIELREAVRKDVLDVITRAYPAGKR